MSDQISPNAASPGEAPPDQAPLRVSIDRVVLRGSAARIDTHRLGERIAAELGRTRGQRRVPTMQPKHPTARDAARTIADHVDAAARAGKPAP